MKYGDAYRVIQLAPAAMNIVRSAISKSDLEMKEAGTNNKKRNEQTVKAIAANKLTNFIYNLDSS